MGGDGEGRGVDGPGRERVRRGEERHETELSNREGDDKPRKVGK